MIESKIELAKLSDIIWRSSECPHYPDDRRCQGCHITLLPCPITFIAEVVAFILFGALVSNNGNLIITSE